MTTEALHFESEFQGRRRKSSMTEKKTKANWHVISNQVGEARTKASQGSSGKKKTRLIIR